MPKSGGRVPIVVLVHGSEHDSARDFYALQRMFPAAGIGAFVYDKRGTGASKGEYTQSYLLLAEDAVAALHEARRLAGSRAGRIGYQAGSQGGWVAPLAALMEPIDFVIVAFGLAVSPLDEDRSAIALDLSRRGFGKDALEKAMKIADASRNILVSGFTSGFAELTALRDKYRREPWFKYVHGDVTFFLLEMPEAKVRAEGPKLLSGAPFHYDPMPVLRRVDVPQLWILAADDTEAPSAETVRRLETLQNQRRPIGVAVFPRTDHGIYEYESTPDGTRTSTRNPDGYFAMMRDFIQRGIISDHYGTALIFHRK
jgi:pimeloyl-ACP methyl ester carboxylesterase